MKNICRSADTRTYTIRHGTVLEDGRCLQDELSQVEQRELAENIMENLMPEIKMVAKFKKKRTGLDEYKAEELEAILVMKVFENFHKFNNVNHLNDKGKRYTISTFIENKAKEAMRDMIIQERNLPVNVIRNLRLINDVVLAVAEEQELDYDEVTAEMVYEKLDGKSISYKMVIALMEVYHGTISIDEMDNPDENLQKNISNYEKENHTELDKDTKKMLDQVFGDFSKLELYILMKRHGKVILQMTCFINGCKGCRQDLNQPHSIAALEQTKHKGVGYEEKNSISTFGSPDFNTFNFFN